VPGANSSFVVYFSAKSAKSASVAVPINLNPASKSIPVDLTLPITVPLCVNVVSPPFATATLLLPFDIDVELTPAIALFKLDTVVSTSPLL
jgi:hypothetical protein